MATENEFSIKIEFVVHAYAWNITSIAKLRIGCNKHTKLTILLCLQSLMEKP